MSLDTVTPEEDEAFRELERTARNALFAICDEAKNIGIVGTCDGVDLPQFVPLSDYEKVVQVLLESSVPPKHSDFVAELIMRNQK